LIQHASENHNPDPEHLAPLDVSIVHVWRGKISMTHSEKEMISFIMQDDYPKENIINVHPRWDMAKWATVIHAQIDLQQPIPLDTLSAYKAYRAKNKGFSNLLQWVQKKESS
jgi:Cft2 family RNA processing exonuclease